MTGKKGGGEICSSIRLFYLRISLFATRDNASLKSVRNLISFLSCPFAWPVRLFAR